METERGDEQERERDQEGPRLSEKDNAPAKEGRGNKEVGRRPCGRVERGQEGRDRGEEEEEAQREQEVGGVGGGGEGRGATGWTQ